MGDGAMTQKVNAAARGIEPLDPSLWFERLQVIGSCAPATTGHAAESSLRHLFHVTQLTPGPLAHLFAVEACEASFERLLEGERYNAAALLLLGPGVDFAISRSGDGGTVSVILSLADGQYASKATADTLSQAVLVAYCTCIGSLREQASRLVRATGRARRTGRSAPRRLSMMH
jgi:hypothetical protein